ncbi:dihydrodipicolinate reductase [Thermanaerovibrio velox DSM 12556]|uniref:4-hydroxy-tetrahydrodipicolinate reductase n=1 Tax=Thermanaerovibrio velox DSM 12556 TaxID=926567 RepID=H0UNH9_9BACT|nr:dihydrodipicolinate reductase C-terminal domain-containing protein [Thermanaerovibrio velox]EHM09386.1 dihydrodipicolinate reductase [Thermanaerovibrio velox DSM 12556]
MNLPLRVFMSGVSGSVGRLVALRILDEGCRIEGAFGLEEGSDVGSLLGLPPMGVKVRSSLREALGSCAPEAAVDFTSAEVLWDNLMAYLDAGVPAVVGTTGLSLDQQELLPRLVAEKGGRIALIPNFSLGVNLVMDFLDKASRFFPWASVTDRHHEAMANAPSGTAVSLAGLLGGGGEVKSCEVVPNVLGGSVGGVRVHSERMPFPKDFSEHQIDLGRPGELIRITVTDFSSRVYVDGVILALSRVRDLREGSLVTSLGEFM